MQKILLTGVNGFIGHFTAKRLLGEGYEVVGIDNMNDYYDVRIKEHRYDELKNNPHFSFHKIDIENISDLEEVFKMHKFDAVINLAARAGVRYSMENPYIYMTTNAMGTLNILEMMKKYGVKKIVLASTSSLYAGQQMPFVETLPVHKPISPYAASKKAAEVMCYTYHYLYNIDVTVVRYFTVYGPAGRPDMSPFRFIKWIAEGTPITLFGDGKQTRDFTYVEDIARGTVKALKPLGYEVINLGGGKTPTSIIQMIERIESLLGKKAIIDYQPANKSDMQDTQANITKAKEILDWEPEIDFPEGLQKSVDWYLANESLAKNIKV